MNKRSVVILLVVLATCCFASVSYAATVPFTAIFTADNYVSDFTLAGGGSTIDFGSKTSGWATSETVTAKLLPGTTYTATWDVVNVSLSTGVGPSPASATSSGNPMAFLGQLAVGNKVYYSSGNSKVWEVGDASPYKLAYNQAYPNNPKKDSIWINVNGGQPVQGIYATAAWIGSSSDGSNANGDFVVTATFKTPGKTPTATPIPGAVWLLGSGVVGLLGMRRKFVS